MSEENGEAVTALKVLAGATVVGLCGWGFYSLNERARAAEVALAAEKARPPQLASGVPLSPSKPQGGLGGTASQLLESAGGLEGVVSFFKKR